MAALHAVEQLANFEVRLAVTGANSAKKEDAKQHARDDLLRAIERLKGVLGLAKTRERYALLASAYKRLAALCETQVEVRSNLTLAAENYRHAHERALERKGFDPYPALNWLSASALLGTTPPDAETLLARCEAAARERYAANRNFFEAVAIPDAALFRALGSGVLARGEESTREVARLARLYKETFTQGLPSTREIDSALDQIEILAGLVEKLNANTKDAKATTSALRMLCQAIAGDSNVGSFRDSVAYEEDPMPNGAVSEKSEKPTQHTKQAAKAATKKPSATQGQSVFAKRGRQRQK